MERVGPPPPPQRPLSVGGAVLVVDPAVALPQGPDSTFGRRILKVISIFLTSFWANIAHIFGIRLSYDIFTSMTA